MCKKPEKFEKTDVIRHRQLEFQLIYDLE